MAISRTPSGSVTLGETYPIAPGAKPSGLVFGMVHFF